MRNLLLLASITIALHAETPAKEQARVEKYLRKWVKKLHMEDWKLEMKVTTGKEIGETLAGWSRADRKSHAALILICRIADYPPYVGSVRREQENTVVHELIHILIFAQTVDGAAFDRETNEAVTIKIAEALVPTS